MATRLYIGDSSKTPAIVKIEEVAKTKFGVSVDTWIGDVVDGVLQKSTEPTALNFAGVTEIDDFGLRYAFHSCTGITSVDLSSVQSVSRYGLDYAFFGCTGITSVDLSSLHSVDTNGLKSAFEDCTGITGVLSMSSLQTVGDSGMHSAFYNNPGITSIDFSSLQTVGAYGLEEAFVYVGATSVDFSSLQTVGNRGLEGTFTMSKVTGVDLSSLQSVASRGLNGTFGYCEGLTTISFPSLTSVQTDSFGSATYNYIFQNCTALTEIHFRADMQATIEAMDGYADKWGATNATIYFDL